MKSVRENPTASEIIDIHCHAAGIGAGQSGCHISDAMRRNWKYAAYLRAFEVTEAEIAEKGDALIIQRLSERLSRSRYVNSAVVLAMDAAVDDRGQVDFSRTELYVSNDFISREVRKYDNLYFGASINPFRRDAMEELWKVFEEKAVLLKWLPSIQHIDPADRRLVPFYKCLAELGLPLLTHTGDEHSFTRAKNELSDPVRLRLPLDTGVTVIAAHAATNGQNEGERNFARILPLFSKYPNLYADISSLTQINKVGHLRRLLRYEAVSGRLLYGTDMPILTTPVVSPLYFIHSIGLKRAASLQKINNPWDRDLKLKEALGLPHSAFERPALLFEKRLNTIRKQEGIK